MELSTWQLMLITCVPFTLIAMVLAVVRVIVHIIRDQKKKNPEDYD